MFSISRSITLSTRGFTLIELLVVISIISLLSTIVLSSVQSIRSRTSQAVNSQTTVQYGNALDAYFEDHGDYPNTGFVMQYCLGDYSDNACGFNNDVSENSTINNALGPYIAAATGQAISYDVAPGVVFEGPSYSCNAIVGGRCIWATIRQLVKGNSRQLCANACSVDFYGGDYWMCYYVFGYSNPTCLRAD